MKVLLCSAAAALATYSSSKVTPTQKVIQLLNDLKAQGEKEKHEEQVQYATFKTFCEDTIHLKQEAIKEGNRRIDSLTASIAKNEADARKLFREIAAHDGDIATWEGDKTASTKVRDIERVDFENLDRDYTESLDALTMAKEVLQNQNYDRAQALPAAKAALMQVESLIPSESRHIIEAFLARDSDDVLDGVDAAHLSKQAPEAHGYRFQSQGVIDLLTKLHLKFDGERVAARKEERIAKEAFEMLSQALRNQVDEATRQRTEKSENRATKLQAKGDAEGTLADTVATRDDDQAYLTELSTTCEKKGDDFGKRQQLRADEIKAIEKATEILSSSAVTGNAEKHLPQDVSFLQINPHSFLQLRRSVAVGTSGRHVQERIASYLKDQGDRIHSRLLAALAVRVVDDPLRKVKQMIKDLIVRLMEEATQETEKQGWCTTELTENGHTRAQKTKKVELLHATIDQMRTSLVKLGEDITQLTNEVAELDRAVAEAMDLRQKEKEKNAETVKDAQEAQTAVSQALTVLQQFYAQAGEATALVQERARPEAPPIFDSPYRGMQAENGGIVGMLEVIAGDFARLEAETVASETASQKEHQQFLNVSEMDKAQKRKDIEHKTANREDQQQLLNANEADLVGTQKELDAANFYYEQLKSQCISSGANYEDRAQRREEEIASLQEALRILKSEDFE